MLSPVHGHFYLTLEFSAAFDYEAQEPDELSLKKGDIVVVLCSDVDEGWLRGILNGKIGVFPANVTKLKLNPHYGVVCQTCPQKRL